MSKKNKNLDRARDIISIDTQSVNSDFKNLLQNDLQFLLKDYFDLGDVFEISINKNTFDYTVNVSFNAAKLNLFKNLI